MQAHAIGLDKEGKFTAPWPRGFFPERMLEVLPKTVRDRVDRRKVGDA